MMAPSLPDAVWALPNLEMLDLDGNEFGHTSLVELAKVNNPNPDPNLTLPLPV